MSRAGDFATSRRGGLTHAELREIEAHRAKERPTPWQALANRYGRPVAEIQSLHADWIDKARPAVREVEVIRLPNATTDAGTFWNEKRVEKLLMLRNLGIAATDIASVLDTTRAEVLTQLKRMGLIKSERRAA